MINKVRRIAKNIKIKINYIGKKVKIPFSSNIGINTKFEGCNRVGRNSCISGEMGFGSYVGSNCNIIGRVGRYCSIANDVQVICGRHPTHGFVSTSPCFFSIKKQSGFTYVNRQKFDEHVFANQKFAVDVGNDVWIGAAVKLLEGVTIGDGAIIAAGSVVVKDVLPYSIVGGVPAKEICKRFSDEKIEFLLKFCWWNKPENWIRDNADSFDDICKFKEMNQQ